MSACDVGAKGNKIIDKFVVSETLVAANDAGSVDVGRCQSFVISDDKIFFGKNNLVIGDDVEKWKKVLGGKYRESFYKPNLSYTWDMVGIYLSTRNNKVSDVSVVLNKKPKDLSEDLFTKNPDGTAIEKTLSVVPNNFFCGRLIVDGYEVKAGATVNDINENKNGDKFYKSYLPTLFDRFSQENKKLGVTIATDENGRYGKIYSISAFIPLISE